MKKIMIIDGGQADGREAKQTTIRYEKVSNDAGGTHNFKGKTVIPFATSGGSSIKKACEDLKAAYPDVNWKEGKLLNRASKKDLEDWVKK
jgi:hypothetical protein